MTSAPKRPNFARFLDDVERRLRVLERRLTGTGGGGGGPVVHGLPPGGDTGQVLTKRTSENFDADWDNIPTGDSSDGGQVDVFTTPQLDTPYDIPAGATRVKMELMGGGGGGGSGRKGPAGSNRFGGNGAGRGGLTVVEFDAAELPSTVYVTVGAGGVGGASRTVNNSQGADGAQGDDTRVSTTPSEATAVAYAVGGARGQGGATIAQPPANVPGGAGHTQQGGVGGAASTAGALSFGGLLGGGGAGRGIASANNIAGQNSLTVALSSTSINPPTAFRVASLGFHANTAVGVQNGPIPGLGGAGGDASTTGNAQAGGNGIYGGGGGGGGASTDSVGDSGAGGLGGDGYIIITTWF